jgi:hypothetical protein
VVVTQAHGLATTRLGACIKMRCDVSSCGPPRSGQGVYQAFANSNLGVASAVSRARNLSSEAFVVLQ